jgi:hypothetical protein
MRLAAGMRIGRRRRKRSRQDQAKERGQLQRKSSATRTLARLRRNDSSPAFNCSMA